MEGGQADLRFGSGVGTSCTLSLEAVSQSDHGNWLCVLKAGSNSQEPLTHEVKMEVATPATVAFGDDVYGVVSMHEGIFDAAVYHRLFFNTTWEGGRGQVLPDVEFFP